MFCPLNYGDLHVWDSQLVLYHLACKPCAILFVPKRGVNGVWRGAGAVYLAGLENHACASTREFESLPLRQRKSLVTAYLAFFPVPQVFYILN